MRWEKAEQEDAMQWASTTLSKIGIRFPLSDGGKEGKEKSRQTVGKL